MARLPAGAPLRYSEHSNEDGAVMLRHACKMGLGGIVSKRLSAPYRSGPLRSWFKVKNPDSPAMIRGSDGRDRDKNYCLEPDLLALQASTALSISRAT